MGSLPVTGQVSFGMMNALNRKFVVATTILFRFRLSHQPWLYSELLPPIARGVIP